MSQGKAKSWLAAYMPNGAALAILGALCYAAHADAAPVAARTPWI